MRGVRRTGVAQRTRRTRLNTGLAEERAGRVLDEGRVGSDAMVDGGDGLAVDKLERVEQRGDRDGSDVDVVADGEVHLVVGREAPGVTALLVVEGRTVAGVEEAELRGRLARPNVELDAGGESPRGVVH